MARVKLPDAIRTAVLREFNHRCAICGIANPQIHHIDEDPNNNDPENLLPLCPNCHLLDQHNPTVPVDPRKLSLFRRFKDPLILSSQFEPLFRRMLFLIEPTDNVFDYRRVLSASEELFEFVSVLQMGDFYGRQLRSLISRPAMPRCFVEDTSDHERAHMAAEDARTHFNVIEAGGKRSIELIVELLRYQKWDIYAPKRTDRESP